MILNLVLANHNIAQVFALQIHVEFDLGVVQNHLLLQIVWIEEAQAERSTGYDYLPCVQVVDAGETGVLRLVSGALQNLPFREGVN